MNNEDKSIRNVEIEALYNVLFQRFILCFRGSLRLRSLENAKHNNGWILPTYFRGRIQYFLWFLDIFGFSRPIFEGVSSIPGARSAPGILDYPKK